MVPDVDTACERFASLGVEFVKKPNDGNIAVSLLVFLFKTIGNFFFMGDR